MDIFCTCYHDHTHHLGRNPDAIFLSGPVFQKLDSVHLAQREGGLLPGFMSSSDAVPGSPMIWDIDDDPHQSQEELTTSKVVVPKCTKQNCRYVRC